MNTKKGMRSVFGDSPKTAYEYVKLLSDKENNNCSVLVIDCYDGIGAMPFIRANYFVDCYETNTTYLKGGVVDEFKTEGLINKIKYEKIKDKVKIYNKNFYHESIEKKYDLVYVYRNLHLKHNDNIEMNKKIKKIISCVKEGGYVYILYYLANNDKDYINFPKSLYFRPLQMKQYFNDNWKILNIKEEQKLKYHLPHPYNNEKHFHRMGYFFAQRINKRKKHKYHYNINNTKKDFNITY